MEKMLMVSMAILSTLTKNLMSKPSSLLIKITGQCSRSRPYFPKRVEAWSLKLTVVRPSRAFLTIWDNRWVSLCHTGKTMRESLDLNLMPILSAAKLKVIICSEQSKSIRRVHPKKKRTMTTAMMAMMTMIKMVRSFLLT